MASPMARPQKHRRTSVYYYRQRVPRDLVALVGREEVSESLKTKNLAEAKVLHAAVAERVALQWANMRLGAQSQTHKSLQALAGEFYREYVEAHDEEPGEIAALQAVLASDEHAIRLSERKRPGVLLARFMADADAFLAKRGLTFTIADHARFVSAISRAKVQAVNLTLQKAKGNYRPDPEAGRFPTIATPDSKPPPPITEKLDFGTHWNMYVSGRKMSSKTVRRFHTIMLGLIAFVGTDDIAAIDEDALVRWRDDLETRGNISASTIKNGHLAAAKAFFNWAKYKRLISINPAREVRVQASSKPLKMRGFRDGEAMLILSATLAPPSSLISPEHAAARRWVPWICAYTGARVNEITQLRKEDVIREFDFSYLKITPEAGTTKTGEERCVPLHPHLAEQGFLDYVAKRPQGPLFYSKNKRRNENGRPQYETVGAKLGEWVRDLGVRDPTVYPNHGWRHRLKTLRRRHGLDKEIVDAIQGHAPETVGDGYGEVEVIAMLREIEKIPAYVVQAAKSTDRRRRKAG